jgi:hypothetical protein
MNRLLVASLVASQVLCMASVSRALEARRFALPTTGDTVTIGKDHLTVEVAEGWIYGKDDGFWSFLSDATNLVVTSDAKVQFTDGSESRSTVVHENEDISPRADRPWGVNRILVDNVPAEYSCSITLSIAIHKEDFVKKLFGSLKQSTPVATAANLSTVSAYSAAVSAITTSLFNTERMRQAFVWTGDVQLGDVVENGIMKPHFIVLISPTSDKDPFVREMTKDKLTYANGKLAYDGKAIPPHSFVVLRVRRASGYDVGRWVFSDTFAPWSVLAEKQFMSIPVLDATAKDQLLALQRGLLTQLAGELSLLKSERRFSMYERAVVMKYYAERSLRALTGQCERVGIAAEQCPVQELAQYVEGINSVFSLPPTVSPDELQQAVAALLPPVHA